MEFIFPIIILLVLLLIFALRENLTNDPQDLGHVKLYDDFDPTKAYQTFEFTPRVDYKNKTGSGYLKTTVKIPLKYIDMELKPLTTDTGLTEEEVNKYNKLRRIELWGMYVGTQTASSLADGIYHSALNEEEVEYRVNDKKYTFIAKVKPGEKFKGPSPVNCTLLMLIAVI
jgi:hypothetical protein